jgi:hypothetical protein
VGSLHVTGRRRLFARRLCELPLRRHDVQRELPVGEGRLRPDR